MPPRGKLIVIEGIDGSGKRTQLDLLARVLEERGVAVSRVSFPNYSGFFGRMAAQFLNGEFGPLKAVDPHFSAMLYAGDRLEAKAKLATDLAQGKMILANRYIASNLAHQGARVPSNHQAEFIAWLRRLEYEIFALPSEDLVVYLRVPPAEAQRLMERRAPREYTSSTHDIQESDRGHLEEARAIYDELARDPRWVTIECFDAKSNAIRPPDSISEQILAAVNERLFAGARAER